MATILLVEDSDVCAHVYRRALEKAGHDVVLAMTVSDAVDALGRRVFDAAVVDTQLPDGDGTALALPCPRVVMSASSGPGVLSKASGTAQLVAAVADAIAASGTESGAEH